MQFFCNYYYISVSMTSITLFMTDVGQLVFSFSQLSSLFFKLWTYDNTFIGDLENTEQSHIYIYIKIVHAKYIN